MLPSDWIRLRARVACLPKGLIIAVLLFSFGYVALQTVLASERRLLAIKGELAIAREIQASILPSVVPETSRLRVAAAYHPMTAVAGEFLRLRSRRQEPGWLPDCGCLGTRRASCPDRIDDQGSHAVRRALRPRSARCSARIQSSTVEAIARSTGFLPPICG